MYVGTPAIPSLVPALHLVIGGVRVAANGLVKLRGVLVFIILALLDLYFRIDDFLHALPAHGSLEDGLYLLQQYPIGPLYFGVPVLLYPIHFLCDDGRTCWLGLR